jgi:cytochrome c-type biogenesis protein CcmH
MKMFKILSLIFWVFGGAYAAENYPFTQATQEAQFKHLTAELRCMVCQHQNLAESDAPLAMDMKHLIHQKVLAGESDSEILAFLTQRYGDAILFKPPLKLMTWVLWFAPLLFLLLGIMIFVNTVMRHKN